MPNIKTRLIRRAFGCVRINVCLFFCAGVRADADGFAVQTAFNREFDIAVHFGEQGVVFAHAYVVAGVEFGAALADDDGTCGNQFVAVGFYAQAFGF